MARRPETLAQAIDVLALFVRPNAAVFEQLGGEALLLVRGQSADHVFRLHQDGPEVRIDAGEPAAPVVSLGISERVLFDLLEGTLDLEAALANSQIALGGDPRRAKLLARCFLPAQSALGLRGGGRGER